MGSARTEVPGVDAVDVVLRGAGRRHVSGGARREAALPQVNQLPNAPSISALSISALTGMVRETG